MTKAKAEELVEVVEVVEELEELEDRVLIRNLSANPMSVLGLAGFGTAEFTEAMQQDERIIGKVKRAIALGLVEFV